MGGSAAERESSRTVAASPSSAGARDAASTAGRVVGATGLAAVGLLHAIWAAGSPWPARDRASLADAVVGSAQVPAAGPTAGVALLALGGAAVVGGAGGAAPLARLIRVGAASALILRGIVGGVAATRVLRLPDPSARFRRLDRVVYRPLCLTLGAAAAMAALAQGRREKMG